jgi:hypothetical protein
MYASLLRISEALDLDLFEQPLSSAFFSNLLDYTLGKEGFLD